MTDPFPGPLVPSLGRVGPQGDAAPDDAIVSETTPTPIPTPVGAPSGGTAPPERSDPASAHSMPHLPGLDGLRGLAVIGVLLFHGGFGWARGGYLGVSTFFTLSGFLITNLLVREWDANGAISLSRFWTRRFRRLLPAAVIAIALVGIVWWFIGTPEQLQNLRADMLASLGYVANWRFLLAGRSYAELFSAPSPLQHFWSLAIEEQFYVVFPLFTIVVLRLGGRGVYLGTLALATAVSVGLTLVFSGQFDRIYYGTDTRAAELLLGALLAVWWSDRSRAVGRFGTTAHDDRPLRTLDVLGIVALVGMFWSWYALPESSSIIAQGGLPLYAIGTTVIVYASTHRGLVTAFLSIAALRWAGLISYGLYLYHWPIFLVLSPDRVDLPTAPLFVLRMAATIAVALGSYFLLEQPVRRGNMLRTGRAALTGALASALVVAIVAVSVTLDPPRSTIAYGGVRIDEFAPEEVQTSDMTIDPALANTNGRRVLLVGDSGAYDLSPALGAAYFASGSEKYQSIAFPGYGLTRPEVNWRQDWIDTVAAFDPTLVIASLGGWDYDYFARNGPEAYARLVAEATGILTANGAKVLWISVLPGGTFADKSVNPALELVPSFASGDVRYADLDATLTAPDGTFARTYTVGDRTVVLRKPDFWHLCPTGAAELADGINETTTGLGWSNRSTPGWQEGAWRDDARYDDPKGGCPGG